MKVWMDAKGVALFPESELEQGVVEAEQVATKLAFRVRNVVPNCTEVWNIVPSQNIFKISLQRREVIVPDDLDSAMYLYILRVIVDKLLLWYGSLPLHGAAITCRDNAFFLFAQSGHGKSFFSNQLRMYRAGINLVGDDHIILSNGRIYGNTLHRIRGRDGKNISYASNSGVAVCPTYRIAFCIALDPGVNQVTLLSPEDWGKELASVSAFKYLMQQPVFAGRRYLVPQLENEVTMDDCDTLVRSLFLDTGKIYKLQGNFDFIEKTLREFVK